MVTATRFYALINVLYFLLVSTLEVLGQGGRVVCFCLAFASMYISRGRCHRGNLTVFPRAHRPQVSAYTKPCFPVLIVLSQPVNRL
jgi:hypothetical protein